MVPHGGRGSPGVYIRRHNSGPDRQRQTPQVQVHEVQGHLRVSWTWELKGPQNMYPQMIRDSSLENSQPLPHPTENQTNKSNYRNTISADASLKTAGLRAAGVRQFSRASPAVSGAPESSGWEFFPWLRHGWTDRIHARILTIFRSLLLSGVSWPLPAP